MESEVEDRPYALYVGVEIWQYGSCVWKAPLTLVIAMAIGPFTWSERDYLFHPYSVYLVQTYSDGSVIRTLLK